MKSQLEFETVNGIIYIGESRDLFLLKESDNNYQVGIKAYPMKYLVDSENASKIMEYKGDHNL